MAMTTIPEGEVPQYEPRITLGNVLSILGTIVSCGGLLVAASVWTGQQGQRIDAVERMVIETRATIGGHENRIRQVEQSSARMDERLLLILDTVREIKDKLDGSK